MLVLTQQQLRCSHCRPHLAVIGGDDGSIHAGLQSQDEESAVDQRPGRQPKRNIAQVFLQSYCCIFPNRLLFLLILLCQIIGK